ncbi:MULTISPECIES: hypothetical protein [Candidatus Fukatsuia]|uniref:hypothetical protein n=1 Tax=Candidatus Fukatsuia TaxID=1927833 RepID=UPI000E759C2B|nr:hypothetical protein [Candidatus Fukatsuia symbiotica]
MISHGILENGQLMIDLDGEYISCSDFFAKIGQCTDKPVNIFMTACHGAAAIDNAALLPKGSSLAVVSDRNEPSLGENLDHFYSLIEKSPDISTLSLLLLYNCTLQNRTSSSLWINNNAYHLKYFVPGILGRHFSATERKKVHSALDNFMNKSDREHIDLVMNKISRIKSIDDITAADYGILLAITNVLCCKIPDECVDISLVSRISGSKTELRKKGMLSRVKGRVQTCCTLI